MTSIKSESPPLIEGSPPSKRRWRFSLRTAFVIVAIAGIVFAGVHYLLDLKRLAQRMSTTNNFKMVGIGLVNHNDARGMLPYPTRRVAPGGAGQMIELAQDPTAPPILSWRVVTGLHMQCCQPFPDMNAPWDSPPNAGMRGTYCRYYLYGKAQQPENPADPASFHTNAMAIIGPGTAFGDGFEPPKRLEDLDTANTILVVETASSGLHWMEPGDFDIRTMPRTINNPSGHGISSRHRTGFHVVFADGTVWYLSNKTPFDELEKFFTVEGGRAHDREEVLGRYVVNRQ